MDKDKTLIEEIQELTKKILDLEKKISYQQGVIDELRKQIDVRGIVYATPNPYIPPETQTPWIKF